MRVSLLGPFHVELEGRQVVPSAPKLRQVLSLLAVNADRVVSSEQLIEELWGDRPPSSATTTLQTYVYQLRKLYRLAWRTRAARPGGDAPALSTSPTGYVLMLASDAVDATSFVRLADRARAELDAGSLEPAVDTLRTALRLWRGPALAEVSTGPLLRAATVWLEEQRRGLTLQRIDADLALRRHHELIGELTAMVAQQPTDESLQSRLMLALYRAGRRLDALRVYQQAREVLAAELGLEPMPELQRVHQAVLVADPAIDEDFPGARAVTSVRGAAEPPDQLPPDVARLVGRRHQVAEVSAPLAATDRSAAPVVVVAGPPGSGKTALCVHVAHKLRARYPDGLLYARLTDDEGRPLDPAEVLGGFLRAAGYAAGAIPEPLDERSSLFRSWSAGRRVLAVLDDVAGAEQIGSLLPTGLSCGTLIAARRRFSDPAVAATVHLGPLACSDAYRLLAHILGEERVNRQIAAAHDLVELCEGLPMALREAAAHLELKPHWPIARQVSRARAREERGSRPATPTEGVHRSLGRTLRLLGEELRAAFCGLARMEDPASLGAVAGLLAVEERRAEELAEELATFGLVEVETTAAIPDGFVYRVPRPYAAAVALLSVGGSPPPMLTGCHPALN